ncbi:MAG: hypothetical protein U1F61_05420 [Opitutaceae bacterium]
MARRRPTTLTAWLHRLTAGLGASLVLLLGVLTVSPEAHAWLHALPDDGADACHHGHAHGSHAPHVPVTTSDEGCVVELFSQGVDVAGAACVLDVHPNLGVDGSAVAPEELHLSPPRYLWQPERGPPGSC